MKHSPQPTRPGLPERLRYQHGMIHYADGDREPITDRDAIPIIELDLAKELVRRYNSWWELVAYATHLPSCATSEHPDCSCDCGLERLLNS